MLLRRLFSLCVLALMGLALVACGGKDPEGISARIDKGDAVGALNILADKLADAPKDPVWNLLALKARLARCAETNCAVSKPADLALMATHAAYAAPKAKLDDTHTLDMDGVFLPLVEKYSRLAGQPTPMIALWQLAPAGLKPRVADGFFAPAVSLLRAGKTQEALTLLQALAASKELPPLYVNWATMVAGMVGNQPTLAESYMIGLRNMGASGDLPVSAYGLLPHALFAEASYASPTTASVAFVQGFMPALQGMLLPQVTSATGPSVARELNAMRTDRLWSLEALTTWPGGKGAAPLLTFARAASPSVPISVTVGQGLALHLANLSLILNPKQDALWKEFLPQAEAYALATGDVDVLGSGLSPVGAAGSVQGAYLAAMFKVIEAQATKNQPMLPLLEQVGGLPLDKQAETRLEKLVQAGLENALTRKDLNAVLAYATFKPDIAKTNRTAVVPLLVETIRNAMRTNKFDDVVKLGEFLNGKMGVDFNLDALILQEFSDTLKQNGVADQLSADGPDVLLQLPATATLDLGPQWRFLQDYFADKPEILNTQLKNMVLTAHGAYGVPVAFYRLNAQFDDSAYPPAERLAYLASAIAASVSGDTKLSGPQMADLVWRLSRIHEGLPMGVLLEDALARCATLEDSRTLWQQAPGPMRQLLANIRPQYADLMSGIDAFAAHKKTVALKHFAHLTTADYGKQAESYLVSYRRTLVDLSGLYVPEADTSFPLGFVRIMAPALAGDVPISALKVTFGNRLGSLSVANPSTLAVDQSSLKTQELELGWDADRLEIPVPSDVREDAAMAPSFDDVFGAPSMLVWKDAVKGGPVKLLVSAKGQTYTFVKVLADASRALDPTGRYTLTVPLSVVSGSAPLIPGGSIIELVSTPDAVDASVAISGKFFHPAARAPLPLVGTYNPANLTADMAYAVPLASGGMAKALLRCQPLAGIVRCAASFQNQSRSLYGYVMAGRQTKESLADRAKVRDGLNKSSVRQLYAAADAVVFATPKEELPVAVSGSAPLATSPVSGSGPMGVAVSRTTGLLPPPSFVDKPGVGTSPVSGTMPLPAPAPAVLSPASVSGAVAGVSPSAGPEMDDSEDE